MSETSLNLQSVSICSYASYESGEQLIEYFKGIRDVTPPPDYSNRIIDIKDDEMVDSELLFGPSGPDPPSEIEWNTVKVNVADWEDDDDFLHIHMNATEPDIENAFSIFKDAVSVVDEVTIHVTGIEVVLHSLLSELQLPIETTGDYDLNGGRLVDGKKSYLIQELEDGEHTVIRYGNTEWYDVDADSVEDLVEQMTDTIQQFLEEVKA